MLIIHRFTQGLKVWILEINGGNQTKIVKLTVYNIEKEIFFFFLFKGGRNITCVCNSALLRPVINWFITLHPNYS